MINCLDYYREKTILITGAAGFIGALPVRVLCGIDCHLICLKSGDREFDAIQDSRTRMEIRPKNIRLPAVWGDLLKDTDIFFHLAAQTSSQFADKHRIEDLELHLVPVVRFMAETVRDLAAQIADQHVKVVQVQIPPDLSEIESRHFVADIRKFSLASEWKPKFSLQAGISKTIRFLKEK